MGYNTVIFDMDGVVIDSGSLWNKSTAKLLAKYNVVYNPDDVRHKLAGAELKDSTNILLTHYGLAVGLEQFYNERIKVIEAEFGNSLNFISGFKKFRDILIDNGIKIGIATSAYDGLVKYAIDQLSLLQLFNGHLYKASDVDNKSKPDPAIYIYAAEQLKSHSSECIVIEDAPNGIQAAHNAGMKCVGISTTFNKQYLHKADIIIDSYKELENLTFLNN